ncbi:skpA [Aphelenchoides avenae]|nr:skpA [Aphelenchus avenae]
MAVLRKSGTFTTLCKDCDLEEDEYLPIDYPIGDISEYIFEKVIDWCWHHMDEWSPSINAQMLEMTDYEHQFFDESLEDMDELLLAADRLDIKSLYYCCRQAMDGKLQQNEIALLMHDLSLNEM